VSDKKTLSLWFQIGKHDSTFDDDASPYTDISMNDDESEKVRLSYETVQVLGLNSPRVENSMGLENSMALPGTVCVTVTYR